MFFTSHAFSKEKNANDVLHIKLSDKIESPRWRGVKNVKFLSENAKEMHRLKVAAIEDRTLDCLSSAQKVKKKNEDLSPWLLVYEFKCARSLFLKRPNEIKRLSILVAESRNQKDWFTQGAYSRFLKEEYLRSSMALLKEEFRANHEAASLRISDLNLYTDWMSNETQFEFYSLARDFARSNDKKEEEELYAAKLPAKPELEEPPVVDDEYTKTIKSEREQFSKYLSLVNKEDEKSLKEKDLLLKQMQKARLETIRDWAMILVSREYFFDTLILTELARESKKDKKLQLEILSLTSDAAFFSGNSKAATALCKKIIDTSPDTIEGVRALFRLGHMSLREGEAKEAAQYFEITLKHKYKDNVELSSMYWRWQAYKILKSDKTQAAAAELSNTYPASYFGLRMRAELNGGKLNFPDATKENIELKLNLDKTQWSAWQRILKLLAAGWSDEAQYELLAFSEPEKAEEKIIWAKVWAAAFDYVRASEIMQRAFTMKPTLMARSTLEIVYPKEFNDLVTKEASRYRIPPEIIWGLMKQESGFHTEIASPVGALGLMQLLPSTARELARDLRMKSGNMKNDLLLPEINVRLGSQYLNRRLRYFDGHVPLALASYNAGIGNIRNWLRARPDLRDMTKVQTSGYQAELWFDELPWSETSFYIKAILRNYLIYKSINDSNFIVSDPVWKLPSKG